jgi:hypothetical protein
MKTVAGAPVLAGCIPPPLPFDAPGDTDDEEVRKEE